MASLLERRKILFNGVEVVGLRRQKQEGMASPLNQLSRFGGFLKGCIIHDQDRARSQLLEEMLFQPDIESLRIRATFEENGGDEPLPLLARNQAGTRPSIPTPFPCNSLSATRPAIGPVGSALKATLIHIDH